MKHESGIYIIQNSSDGRSYIGQSTDIHRRILAHKNALSKGVHKNIFLQRAYNKYGKEIFSFDVIEYCSPNKLNEREIFWISQYNAFGKGYNLTAGGEGNSGWQISDELRQKFSQMRKGKYTGEKNPMFGKSWKDYISEDDIIAHNQRISKTLKEKHHTAKRIVCINDGVEYPSCKDAAKKTGLKENSIGGCCRGNLRSAGKNSFGIAQVFVFSDRYVGMTQDEIDELIRLGNVGQSGQYNGNAKQVINITTGEIFNTLKDAAIAYKINGPAISNCISGLRKSAGVTKGGAKCAWMELRKYKNASNSEIQKIKDAANWSIKGGNNPMAKGVICLTTGDSFPSISDAAKMFHVDPSSIVKCCKGKKKFAGKHNGEILTWKYDI